MKNVIITGFKPGTWAFLAQVINHGRFSAWGLVFITPLNSTGFEPAIWCF
jgi:hypothetical protein